MSDPYYEIGRQLRALLRGFLSEAPSAPPPGEGGDGGDTSKVVQWGPKIELAGLPDLYHPQEVRAFTAPPGGIDNLHLSSVDKFFIPGRGEFTVDFRGMMQVARDHPTTRDWATAQVFVNLTDMALKGTHPELGKITVKRNPAIISAGQTFGPGVVNQAASCRIAAGVQFDMPDMGMTVFNREPILLMNDGIEAIPPVEDPNGAAHLYKLPLYDTRNPTGKPVAYLTSLRYTVGNYVTQAEASAFRAQVA